MKRAASIAIIYQLLIPVLALTALFVSLGAFPADAAADSISITSQTLQIIPPGSNTCPQVSATDFTPYVYDGSLDAFEFTVPDTSYVALGGSVGDTPVSFQFMTRHVDAEGNLRIHVDVNSTPITGTLPLEVTLISADGSGQLVCAAIISMSVGSGPVQNSTAATQAPSPIVPPATIPAPSNENPSSYQPNSTGSSGTYISGSSSTPVSTTSSESSSTNVVATTATASVVNAMQNPLAGLCTSAASAYRLWLVLLVIFAILVGSLLWAEFPMSADWARTPERIATIIFVLLLLLLGFWYFSASCRAALWMPLVAFLIAILGLLGAFWNHPRMTQLLLIEDSNP